MSRNPYAFLDLKLPTNGQPTEVLAFRFSSWRKIIRSLNVYLKEFASVQDEVYRQNVRLSQSVNFPFFQYGTSSEATAAVAAANVSKTLDRQKPPAYHTGNMHPEDEQTCRNFLPYGSNSLADVPATLLVYHNKQAEAAHRASKEILYNVIPRLEDLRRDLVVKIKEIKNLSSDFKNSVAKEQASFHRELAAFNSSIEMLVNNSVSLNAKSDPYLLKQFVGRQLTRQVNEENYLLEAYLNIQSSGKELERVVAQEIQSALNVFAKLVGQESANIDFFAGKILNGFVSKEAVLEWDEFIKRDPNFVDPNLKLRNIQDIAYPNMNSSLAYEIRSGFLERRSKYLKSYSRAWYVLTPTFLHEFKSSDRRRDPLPVMSIPLNDCVVDLDKKSSSDSHKFILNTRISRSHKWVFRAENREKLRDWYSDLTTLISMESPVQRALKYFPSQQPVEEFLPPKQVTTQPTTEFVPQHEQPRSSRPLSEHYVESPQHAQSKEELLHPLTASERAHSRTSSVRHSARSSRILENVDPLDAAVLENRSPNSIAPVSISRTVSPISRGATPISRGASPTSRGASMISRGASQISRGASPISRGLSPELKNGIVPSSKPEYMLLHPENGNRHSSNEAVPVQSDLFSETSAVTSLDEPYGAGLVDANGLSVDRVLSRAQTNDLGPVRSNGYGGEEDDDDLERRKLNSRGRFGSEVLLNQFPKPELEGEGEEPVEIHGATHPYRRQLEDDLDTKEKLADDLDTREKLDDKLDTKEILEEKLATTKDSEDKLEDKEKLEDKLDPKEK